MKNALFITLITTYCMLFLGCSYFQQRKDDLLDIVYLSGGRAHGISADAFVTPYDFPTGLHWANVYGWEGREFIHRREMAFGFVVGGIQQDGDNNWRDASPHVNLIDYRGHETAFQKQIDHPVPAVYDSFIGYSVSEDKHEPSECDAINPDIEYEGYPAHASWGIGIGLTPGFLTVRAGLKPFKIVNFATGILGFHLFSPYKSFSNGLDFESLRKRGLLKNESREDYYQQLVKDLRHDDPFIVIYSIRMLGYFPEDKDRIVEILKPYLHNDKDYYRIAAIIALDQLDPSSFPAIPAIREYLKNYHGGWRRHFEDLIKQLELKHASEI